MKNSKIYKKLSQSMNKKVGGEKMYKTIISLGLLIPTLLYLILSFRILDIEFLNYIEISFVFLPIFLTGLVIYNFLKNKIQLNSSHSLNENKILKNKQYLILLFGLFGFYLLYFKGLFSVETSSDLVFIVTIYSFGAVIFMVILSEILSLLTRLLEKKNVNLIF